ncbi:MAG: hypothetical protein CMM01_16335 [Rhodopirellula sp.]|nr:hypothetical protein [Rhodopirellula sp.]
MKFLSFLLLSALVVSALPSEAQNRNGKGKAFRKQADTQGNYHVTVVDVPSTVASKFERLKPKVLLYRPITTAKTKLPLVVTLHGSGGGRRDIEQKKWQGAIRQLLKPENQKYDALVLEPQSEGVWEPDSLETMLDFVLSENLDVDPKRIYCVGYSMGGKGTWEWAMNYPDRFAAIIPKGFIPDLSKIDGMVNLPIWAMVGDKDSKPRVEGIPAMKKKLVELGSTKVKISVFEGANHATASGRAKEEPGVFEWLFSLERE